jgi:hypothetical protein
MYVERYGFGGETHQQSYFGGPELSTNYQYGRQAKEPIITLSPPGLNITATHSTRDLNACTQALKTDTGSKIDDMTCGGLSGYCAYTRVAVRQTPKQAL